MLSTLVSLLLISALLDKGGKYLNKIVEDPNETLGQIDVEFVDNFLKQDNSFEKKSWNYILMDKSFIKEGRDVTNEEIER